jgi:hypothetical protein
VKRILMVVVSVFLFTAAEASVAAATTITIPAGDGAAISGVTARGCDATQYGYSIGGTSVVVAGWGGGCGSTSLSGAQIRAASSARTLQVYAHDTTCGAVYYSDGSGRANHALVSGSGPFQVDLNDAGGGGCGGAGNTSVPSSPGAGNLSATVTILTPPTVTLSVPAATGTNGYFDATDLTTNHGSIAVGVSASDNSGSGVSNISCTQNGNPVSLSAAAGVNTATMTGAITLTADGVYAISCIASDNNGETGSSGSANVATYQIDTTVPTLLAPNQPVRLDAPSPAGATLSSYDVSASDADAGDTATVTCSPAAPQTFPLGATTVSCTATDRAGNTATGSFEVDVSASQSIAFAPVVSPATIGTSAPLSGFGGSSGQPVTFSVDAAGTSPSDACTVSQSGPGAGMVSYAHLGSCEIEANQAASANGQYTAAQTVSQTVTVQPVSSAVTLSTPQATVFGQSAAVMATVSEADHSSPMGAVQFTRNGADLGSPVPVTGGTATSPSVTTGAAPGSYQVRATFEPAQATVYASASAVAVTSVVSRASTIASLHVSAKSISATVAAVGPGAGTPTGSVTFSVGGKVVGSASLSGGIATLDSKVPAGAAHVVAASYGGEADFTGSSASTNRSDPSITAQLSSSRPRSRDGWYSTSVRVKFTCTAHGAALIGACPSPVTLAGSGGGQSVTRTITATDGGATTVVVSPISIDRTRPHVGVAAVRSGATYLGTPPTPRCRATDALSGVASCVLRVHKHVSGRGLDITTVSYTAIATDRAGSTRRVSGTYRALGIYIAGVAYRRGKFQVKLGRTYTIVVMGAGPEPRYIDASPDLQPPSGADNPFHPVGRGVWVEGVTLAGAMRRYRDWNLGIKIGNVLHIVPIYQL